MSLALLHACHITTAINYRRSQPASTPTNHRSLLPLCGSSPSSTHQRHRSWHHSPRHLPSALLPELSSAKNHQYIDGGEHKAQMRERFCAVLPQAKKIKKSHSRSQGGKKSNNYSIRNNRQPPTIHNAGDDAMSRHIFVTLSNSASRGIRGIRAYSTSMTASKKRAKIRRF